MLEKLAVEKGHIDLEDIDRGVIQDSVNARSDKPLMAGAWLSMVSAVFLWATGEYLEDPLTGERKLILEENPCIGVRRPPIPRPADPDEEIGHPTFTDDDLAHFEASYPEGTLERKVYAVLLYTGLRVGDAARIGRQHIQKDGTLKIITEKTGSPIQIGIVEPFARALAAGPHGPSEVLNFLTTERGKVWDKGYLGQWFGERCRSISLDRSAHGLRKAAARLYAERGATVPQLMALFGWSGPAMAIKYVQQANRKAMSLDAQRLRFEEQKVTIFPPTRVSGGGMGVD